jgi:hypothetical protein
LILRKTVLASRNRHKNGIILVSVAITEKGVLARKEIPFDERQLLGHAIDKKLLSTINKILIIMPVISFQ